MNVETEESASTNQKDGNMVLRLREEHKLDFTATGNLKILSTVEVFHPVRTISLHNPHCTYSLIC
jgi:hypothetical protein